MTDPKITQEQKNQGYYKIRSKDLRSSITTLNDIYMNRHSDEGGIFRAQDKVNKLFKKACEKDPNVNNYRHLTALKAFLDPIAEGAKSLPGREKEAFIDYMLDFNGDGKVDIGDIEGFDTNGDGEIDNKGYDKNCDGFIDEKEIGNYAKYLANTISPRFYINSVSNIDSSIKNNSIFDKNGTLNLDFVKKDAEEK